MAYLLKKEDFPVFVNLLIKSYDVIAPVKSNKLIKFSKIDSFKDIDLSKNSYYSPKKYFLPDKEKLFSFKKKKNLLLGEKDVIEHNFETEKRIIFGMRLCDVYAIKKLDKFYNSTFEDPYYKTRRDNTFIVAFKCNSMENDNCFCDSFENENSGYDLFFEKVDEGFIVDVKTEKGKSLIDKKLFKASAREVNIELPVCDKRLNSKTVIPKTSVWDEYAEKCLSCCACNVVCPTCGCFDIKDKVNLDLRSGERIRLWDFCQATDYTKVAGNFTFRQGRIERYKHRYLCKFKYFPENFSDITCTGCGRCITACPTNICNIPEILDKLKIDMSEKLKKPIKNNDKNNIRNKNVQINIKNSNIKKKKQQKSNLNIKSKKQNNQTKKANVKKPKN